MRRLVSATVMLLLFSGTALAGHCPADAKAIDSALPQSSLGAMEKQEIQSLRDKGMELHNSGDHRQSEKVLAEAMRKLLMGGFK